MSSLDPINEKTTQTYINDSYYVVSSLAQGWRRQMEDTLEVCLEPPEDTSCIYAALFDGHSGSIVSTYACENLRSKILNHRAYQEGDIDTAIKEGFVTLDSEIRERSIAPSRGGSTAIVIIIKESTLYCGNLGDSRGIAYVRDGVIPLSFDHKPSDPFEEARILTAGHTILNGRIDGCLNISRTFGDFRYKNEAHGSPSERAVSCLPEVIRATVDAEWQFAILASDGIWGAMASEAVGDFIKARIDDKIQPQQIVEELVECCIAPHSEYMYGSDNMTVILILFLRHLPSEYRRVLDNDSSSKLVSSEPSLPLLFLGPSTSGLSKAKA